MEPTTFGRYELVSLLSESELTEVWLARQGGDKLVALRRLNEKLGSDSEQVDRFLDEARINALLHHDHIVPVFELGDVNGRYFLVTEYIEGMSLEVLVYRANELRIELPIAVAVALVIQAAEGMHHAHEQRAPDGSELGIVHRELAPKNLVVGYDGVLKISDFGAAQANGRRAHTTSGPMRGTPTYMSPEQVTGAPVDRRADVFGLGILLWELLAGRGLFARATADAIYDAITAGDVPPPSSVRPDISPALDAVVARALADKPKERYPTSAALAAALRALDLGSIAAVRGFLDQHFSGGLREREVLLLAMTTQREFVVPAFDSLSAVQKPDDAAAFDDGNTVPDRPVPAPPRVPPRRAWMFVAGAVALGTAIAVALLASH